MYFIHLHEKCRGIISINVPYIVYLKPLSTGTSIGVVSNTSFSVTESHDEVLELITRSKEQKR